MLISLTPAQLRALGGPINLLLADILDQAANPTITIGCPSTARRPFGRHLHTLQDAGLIRVDDPGSWTRASYTLTLAVQTDAQWFLANGAIDRWPRIYPDIWDQLRGDFPDLPLPTFRQRIHNSVLTALGKEAVDFTGNILTWLANGLNIPAPAPTPDADPATPGATLESPVNARVLRKILADDPGYLRRCRFQDDPPGGAPPA
jgi:hypothetical protein